MLSKKTFFAILLLLILFFFKVKGQGCSDAGFCTMGAMKPNQSFDKKNNLKLRSVELSYYQGHTTNSRAIIRVINLDANFSITKNLFGQIKLPYFWVNGDLAQTTNFGDISLSLTQRLITTEKFNLSASIGAKIPVNNSDIKSNGKKNPSSKDLVLPMYYQTSLGSFDLIFGASIISSKWLIATGAQIALTANNNTWNAKEWSSPPYQDTHFFYNDANKLKRGTDVMLRVERNFRFSKYSFNIGILSIFRVIKDQIIDRTTGKYKKLEGTVGLVSSVIGGAAYNFNTKNTIKLTYAGAMVNRKINPDGLKRPKVIILAYLFKF